MRKKFSVLLLVTTLTLGLSVLTGCGDKKASSADSKGSPSSSSSKTSGTSDSKDAKTSDKDASATDSGNDTSSTVSDANANAIVYYGTKDHFEEFPVTVDETKQRKEILQDLIAEIAKHANYDISMTDITIGNKQINIEFAESFKPDEETADKIYDSIYQTCYKAFGVTSDYFNIAGSDEVIKRSIND